MIEAVIGLAPNVFYGTGLAPAVVTLAEIEGEDWTLNILRYVLLRVAEDIPPLPEAVAAFKAAQVEARAAEVRLREVLTTGGRLKRVAMQMQ